MFCYFKHRFFWTAALLVCLPLTFSLAQISLAVPKGHVIKPEARAKVLEMGSQLLSETDDDFVALSKEAETPYAFERPKVVVEEEEKEKPAEKVIVYEDASVLDVVARDFSKQVRGTLARGETSFLQLKGGQMVEPGTEFPVTIPQAKGQVFKVIISEVTDKGYTLKLGDAEKVISLSGSTSGSGAVRND